MKQKHKQKRIRKIDQYIRSEIAVGIILILSVLIGGFVWLGSKNSQADLGNNKYAYTYTACDKSQGEVPDSIVFLGDSITALNDWNSLLKYPCIINAGIPGNTTDNIKSRLDAAISIKPQKLFLMMGINDLLRGKDVSYVLTNYEITLNDIKMQLPGTKIYMQSVLPINNDISKIGKIEPQKIIELNTKLKELAEKNKIQFIDLYPFFCGADNKMYKEYAYDGVHPSPAGYAVWKNLIEKYIAN